jgi:hypothetical protein
MRLMGSHLETEAKKAEVKVEEPMKPKQRNADPEQIARWMADPTIRVSLSHHARSSLTSSTHLCARAVLTSCVVLVVACVGRSVDWADADGDSGEAVSVQGVRHCTVSSQRLLHVCGVTELIDVVCSVLYLGTPAILASASSFALAFSRHHPSTGCHSPSILSYRLPLYDTAAVHSRISP